MSSLRIPPLVGQRTAILPDGNIDPESLTDCGEACLSSVTLALRSMWFEPGCVRVTIGSPTGFSDGEQLEWWLGKFELGGAFVAPNWGQLQQLRHQGRYVIALGDWVQLGEHWMVFYSGHGSFVRAMDPWTKTYTTRTEEEFTAQTSGLFVEVRPQ